MAKIFNKKLFIVLIIFIVLFGLINIQDMIQKMIYPKKYETEVKAALKEKFGYKNDMMIPKLHKIVLNMGVGEASHNSKIADAIQAQLTKIAGQHAVVTKAKKSIASYKLREVMPVGAMVTLRGERKRIQ